MPNINPKTGYAYGVMDARKAADDLYETIVQNGVNLRYEAGLAELKRGLDALVKRAKGAPYEELEDLVRSADLGVGWSICYVDGGELDADELWEDIEARYSERYDDDEDSYEWNGYGISYLGGAPLLWTYDSHYVTACEQCSPCVPGAGDLDSPDPFGGLAHCPSPGDVDYNELGFSAVWMIIPGGLKLVHGIPPDTKRQIDDFIDYGCKPGGFLTAVFGNDLMAAVAHADEENAEALAAIAKYVYNKVPIAARQDIAGWKGKQHE